MKVTESDVLHVAALAHLELTPDERAGMLTDLNNILQYIDRLNELDTTDVPPASGGIVAPVLAMRNDELRPCLTHEEAIANAPQTDGTYFKVPKVIER